MNIRKARTYVFIDVSNIRSACFCSCGFNLDFDKLYAYLSQKYPKLRDARFYEGISRGDEKRAAVHTQLAKTGYTICALSRKSYTSPAKRKKVTCKKCGTQFSVQTAPPTTQLKSNVDVYLASDMLELVAKSWRPVHIIIVSCDGDYAEAIRAALRLRRRAFITILATPKTDKNNYLSSRLSDLRRGELKDRIAIVNINTIRKYIS